MNTGDYAISDPRVTAALHALVRSLGEPDEYDPSRGTWGWGEIVDPLREIRGYVQRIVTVEYYGRSTSIEIMLRHADRRLMYFHVDGQAPEIDVAAAIDFATHEETLCRAPLHCIVAAAKALIGKDSP